MVSSSLIRERIAQFLDEPETFKEFEGWLVWSTRDILATKSPAAISLAGDVEALLVEYASACIGEVEMRQALSQILGADTVTVTVSDAPRRVISFRGPTVRPTLVQVVA